MKKIMLLLVFISYYGHTATFQFIFGAGFSDTTPVSPVGGNSGTTLGQQRQILMQAVGDVWGGMIQSDVNIVVDASFTTLPCQPNGAVLGSAGPTSLTGNFPSAPISNTWYPRSLADAIRGVDNNPGLSDITAEFNSQIDAGCFNGGTYYYGINGDAPANQVQLFSTALHELGHGLGFTSLADSANGSFPNGWPAIYDRFLYDNEVALSWLNMNNSQRLASMTNDPFLVWNGSNVNTNATNYISSGFNGGLVRMYAPNPYEGGSSVSHFSSAAFPDLLMEPVLGNISFNQVDLTPDLFRDLGYTISDLIFENGFE